MLEPLRSNDSSHPTGKNNNQYKLLIIRQLSPTFDFNCVFKVKHTSSRNQRGNRQNLALYRFLRIDLLPFGVALCKFPGFRFNR